MIKSFFSLKIKKPFSMEAEGLKLASSPYWKRLELLKGI